MNVELRAPRLDELEPLTDLINRDSDELYGEREESGEAGDNDVVELVLVLR